MFISLPSCAYTENPSNESIDIDCLSSHMCRSLITNYQFTRSSYSYRSIPMDTDPCYNKSIVTFKYIYMDLYTIQDEPISHHGRYYK